MRVLQSLLLALFVLTSIVLAAKPVRNLSVTLRGKKYDVEEATTVAELQERVMDMSGVSSEQTVLFDGKRLEPTDSLTQAGVSDGAQLNMVPVTKKKKTTSSSASTASSSSSPSTTATKSLSSSAEAAMEEYLKAQGVDPSKLEELLGGNDGKMPDMEESIQAMTSMMNSPIFQEYMNDPEKLEQSRQMILNNPMLKSMMAGMPGMEELLNDPDAFRQAMQAAASMYKDMDPAQLMAMMGGSGMPPGMGGGGGGLFDGTLDSSSTAAAALDELDEDD